MKIVTKALFIAMLPLLCVVFDADAAGLKAGAGKRSIVPPFPTRMGGYFDRSQTFTGVKSPVNARALVLENGEKRIALINSDLVNVSRSLTERVRAEVEAKTGIAAGDVLVCAAHNHSGPAGYSEGSRLVSPYQGELADFLVEQMTAATVEAAESMRPARLGFDYGRADNIARNRQQNNSTVIDPEVGVLRVEDADSRDVIAVLFNFTGHPVILGSNNLELCGEYPGQAAATVEHVLGGVALFTQGACGDVTMIRRGSVYEEVVRLGKALAGEVIKTAELITPGDEAALASVFQPVRLGVREIPSVEDAQAAFAAAKDALDAAPDTAGEYERKQLERAVDDAEWMTKLAGFAKEDPALFASAGNGSVQLMQLGPLVLAGIPGELFVEYQLEMKQRVRQQHEKPFVVVGFANDYLGYIVTPRARITGGYEQATARVDQHAGRALTEAAMELANLHVKE